MVGRAGQHGALDDDGPAFPVPPSFRDGLRGRTEPAVVHTAVLPRRSPDAEEHDRRGLDRRVHRVDDGETLGPEHLPEGSFNALFIERRLALGRLTPPLRVDVEADDPMTLRRKGDRGAEPDGPESDDGKIRHASVVASAFR